MPEYASLDYDIAGGQRLACAVERTIGRLISFKLDQDAVPSGTVEIVPSGVGAAWIMVLPDRRWVVVYNVGNSLFGRVSEDGGESWGAQESIPVPLMTVLANPEVRFSIAYLPRHRLFALVYAKVVPAGGPRHFVTALRRDNAGVWTQGADTELNVQSSAVVGNLLPLSDGTIYYAGTNLFISNFGWNTMPVISNLVISPISNPRFGYPVRAIEHQTGVIIHVGAQVGGGLDPVGTIHRRTCGWTSLVIWRVAANQWRGLRDSGFAIPPTDVMTPHNYISLGPLTIYTTVTDWTSGYTGQCGMLLVLSDGSPELLYHDRSGNLAFKRNRMTAHSYYPDPLQPGFGLYESTYWRTSRRDVWE